jgi:hypothetical protein
MEQVREDRVPQVVAVEPGRGHDALERRETCVRPLPLGDGHRAIERVEG